MKDYIRDKIYTIGSHNILNKIFLPFKGKAGILCYHRVVEDFVINNEESPQKNLLVSKQNFEDQVKYLKKYYEIISIGELKEHIHSNSKEFKVVITFDDGYKDNKEIALPILEKYSIPATIYVVTRFLSGETSMWWYDLWSIVKARDIIEFEFLKKTYILLCNSKKNKLKSYYSLMQLFIKCDYSQQLILLNKIREKIELKDYSSLVLNKKDIFDLSKNKLVTIGSHTHNHVSLKYLDSHNANFELEKSKKILENLTKDNISHFCYPYGTKNDFKKRDMKLVESNGYQTATQTETFKIKNNLNFFGIPRFSVRNFDHRIIKSKINGLDNLIYTLIR